MISNNSFQENEKSSSLSSNDEGQEEDSNIKKPKNNKKRKVENSSSINSLNFQKQFENNSNKNVCFYNNNEVDENCFRNDITFFRSPKVYSNHTSNKSLKSDINSYFLNISDYSNLNNTNFKPYYIHDNEYKFI